MADLRTRPEWTKAGFNIPGRCKPIRVETVNGKEVYYFGADQAIPKLQNGEACNWTYDVKRKIGNLEHVEAQLKLAWNYAEKLRYLERCRRRKVDELLRSISPEYRELLDQITTQKDAIGAIRDGISRANSEARCRSITEEQQAEIDAALKTMGALYEQKRLSHRQLFQSPAVQSGLGPIEEEHDEALHVVRGEAIEGGLYWGTEGGVTKSLSKIRKGRPPRPQEYDGTGFLRAQFIAQKGKPPLTWTRILSGADSRIKAERRGGYCDVSIRLGGKGRQGEWVKCHFRLHREPPPDAEIKEAKITVRSQGYQKVYGLCLTLVRRGGMPTPPCATEGIVGVDLGWRLVPGGLRVAYWYAGPNPRDHGELILPINSDPLARRLPQTGPDGLPLGSTGNLAGYVQKIKDLQSIRDDRFNAMMAAVIDWAKDQSELPDWLEEIRPHLHLIRSHERMLAIVDRWRENRIPGDDPLWEEREENGTEFCGLAHWAAKERHLFYWERSQQKHLERWRKKVYEAFWRTIRKRFAVVVVEDMDVSKMRRRPKPEEVDILPLQTKQWTNLASIGLLRQLAGTAGTIKIPAKNTTRNCHCCGGKCDWDHSRLRHQCEHCGATWDQDLNAAANLLASGKVVNESPGAARGTEEEEGQEIG